LDIIPISTAPHRLLVAKKTIHPRQSVTGMRSCGLAPTDTIKTLTALGKIISCKQAKTQTLPLAADI
jgi:hypothetical protein